MERNVFLGVDPGKTGASAFIGPGGLDVEDWCGVAHFSARVEAYKNYVALAAVEDVHSLPGEGVVSAFTFGRLYGEILGVLAAHGVRTVLVRPQEWQAGQKRGRSPGKGWSVEAAKRLFPQAELHGPRGGMYHGRSDAILIAYYAMLHRANL